MNMHLEPRIVCMYPSSFPLLAPEWLRNKHRSGALLITII